MCHGLWCNVPNSVQGHIARLHCIQLHCQKITKVTQRIKRTIVIIAVRVHMCVDGDFYRTIYIKQYSAHSVCRYND